MPDGQAKTRDPKAYSSNSSRIYSMICPTELCLGKLPETKTNMKLSCLNRQCNSTNQDYKDVKFRTVVGCTWWLLVATWSFSLQLLQNHPADENRRRKRVENTHLAADRFFLYLDFFISFSFPSRTRTWNAVPDYLPGIKEADGGGVAVVLLLFQLQQSSTSPLPFSRHLCWSYCASFLRTKRRERDREGLRWWWQCICLQLLCTYYVARY